MADLEGVENVDIDFPTGRVTVTLSGDHPATREQLVQAIDDSGFTLDRIDMPES